MVVCTVLLVVAGIAVGVLLHSDRPLPRHVFMFEMVARLSESQGEQQEQSPAFIDSAA